MVSTSESGCRMICTPSVNEPEPPEKTHGETKARDGAGQRNTAGSFLLRRDLLLCSDRKGSRGTWAAGWPDVGQPAERRPCVGPSADIHPAPPGSGPPPPVLFLKGCREPGIRAISSAADTDSHPELDPAGNRKR